MKKFLSVILASVLVFSLAACSKSNTSDTKQNANTPATSAPKKDEFKPKEVTKFGDILDNMANKDNYFTDINVIKLTTPSKAYAAKADTIVANAMKEKNVDVKANAKTYNYYKNVKMNKEHKVYVVAIDASKVPTDLYEVNMTVNDKDEPALKDVKKVDNAINDAFKTQFAKEVK
ncbi:hypothetical protein NBE98_05270 [Clostridium swellfunianum]|uniref:hypothetical protein n=1 Tax=Clostridium swellfunianum TaxID=1367462 RepID=UPI00202E5897|nr:hypothetical protein [Clostridium swellfunianum]MCM0647786.1 hypothetical protein [Clostridium swellfunianum]